jgi:hypothetical protein
LVGDEFLAGPEGKMETHQDKITGVVISAEARGGHVSSPCNNPFVGLRLTVRRVDGGDVLLPWISLSPTKTEELIRLLSNALGEIKTGCVPLQ